jgi:hypothetical protein
MVIASDAPSRVDRINRIYKIDPGSVNSVSLWRSILQGVAERQAHGSCWLPATGYLVRVSAAVSVGTSLAGGTKVAGGAGTTISAA